MPGIVGIVKRVKETGYKQELLKAVENIRYRDWYKDDEIFEDDTVAVTRTHLNIIGEKSSPASDGGFFCWVEGETYNIQEVDPEAEKLSDVLIKAYKNDNLNEILKLIDGYYCAVIYDKAAQKITAVSDRYGLKPLFIWKSGNKFGFSSELKAFLPFSDFQPEISKDAIKCMLELGHFVGNMTWFDNVQQISAATVLTYDIVSLSVKSTRYWNWSEIKKLSCDFDKAAVKLAELLKRAVVKRTDDSNKIGISLSGGLDSRALLASCHFKPLTFTFGKEDSMDVQVALKVAKLKGVENIFFELNPDNWYENREFGVWRTDGMLTLLHMHGISFYEEVHKHIGINLNGFAGDAVLGGSFLTGSLLNRKADAELARSRYKSFYEKDDLNDEFYDLKSVEPYLLNNRVRKFTNMGTLLSSHLIENRKPFMDNELIEFVYSLPDEYKIDSRIYNKALLHAFPELYQDIPWERKGVPVSQLDNKPFEPSFGLRLKKSFSSVYCLLLKILKNVGVLKLRRVIFGLRKSKSYTEYNRWLKDPRYIDHFKELLGSEASEYRQYTDVDFYQKYYVPHLKNHVDYAEEIGRALTIELWLRQIKKRFKN